MRAATTPGPRARVSRPSTSSPASVSRRAISSSDSSTGQSSRSHFREIRIWTDPLKLGGPGGSELHPGRGAEGAGSTRRPSGQRGSDRTIWWSKLLQETHVVLEERAQVVDAVAEHGEAVDAHAEGVTGELLRVVAHAGEHVGVHHAGAQHFQPAGVLADLAAAPAAERMRDVHLGGRVGEGEVARAQARLDLGAEAGRGERVS